jgi:hypothetical protein
VEISWISAICSAVSETLRIRSMAAIWTFLQSGTNTLVRVDANGGMDNAAILATLLNVALLETDTANFALT